MRASRQLNVAILIWRRGEQIDTALHTKLAEQGYDVPALERRYCA